ncbi:Protein HIRA [Lamellibrachia satsuma]|nr:Protein HIRA [Lamellibrachia satsuma]
MKLLKPSWVTHGGKPIFSIDIHPDGSRFATGGQGDNSGKVVIWNMAPVKEEKDEKDKRTPKMLCQMDNHLACVNSVRWSYSGKYLASGGDDKLIMIWQTSRYTGASSVFGSNIPNVEQWRVGSTLRGHSGDVLDVAWSPHDRWLASCSIDNTIVIWNAHKFPEQVAVLRGHSGLVKGVTWDPVSKYLASQSDDKSLRVWRTLDWKQEVAVTEPFHECGGTTHVLRVGWSPDGQYVVSAHAMNNSGPTAQIVERDGWQCGRDFVGHRKAITVVRFNPNIMGRKKKGSDKVLHYCCCAIGSRDRSVSIWLTALKRPLVVLHDLFTNSVLDISWSRSGMQLLCCSSDGTVAYMDFTPQELGTPLTLQEKDALQQQTYGKSVNQSSHIIETPAMLGLQQPTREEQSQEPPPQLPQPPSQLSQPAVNASQSPGGIRRPEDVSLCSRSSTQYSNKQIETRTKDGKRRITPIFLAPQPDLGDVPLPFSATSQPTFSSTTEQSQIVVEKQQHENIAGGLMSPPSSGRSLSPSKPVSGGSEIKSCDKDSTPHALHSKLADGSLRQEDEARKGKGVKRKLVGLHPGLPPKKKDGRGRPRKDRSAELLQTSQVTAGPTVQQAAATAESRVVYCTSKLKLPASSIQGSTTVQVSGCTDRLLQVDNNMAHGRITVHRLSCQQAGKSKWEINFDTSITACVANSEITGVACTDHSVCVCSTATGCKISCCLVLDSKVSFLRCNDCHLLAITCTGSVFVWNFRKMTAVIKNESLVPIVPDSDTKIVSCDVTQTGLPVVSLNNGKSYTFMLELGCWVMLANRDDKCQLCSEHHSSVLPPGPLATLQAVQRRADVRAGQLYRTDIGFQQSATLSHLQNQMLCARALNSNTEYHFWLLTYVRYLVQHGMEDAIRELCDDLLGPVCRSKSTHQWDTTILGYRKRGLLDDILPIIGTNLSLQRLFTEYREQLQLVK